MFKKKSCNYCGHKITSNYDFCPSCGNPTKSKSNSKDWGMLGKDDYINQPQDGIDSLFGGISGNMLNKMLGSAMKMLEKEMKKEATKQQKNPNLKSNFRLSINGKEINLNQGNFMQQPKTPAPKKPIKEVKPIRFTKEKQKKFVKLKKLEPQTHIRRLSNKVIYEIKLPTVQSIKDVSISRLENSIEIKAIAKTKAYHKLIPISLPITSYNLSKGKLTLELEAKN